MILTANNEEIHHRPVHAREVETVFGDDQSLEGAAFYSWWGIQAEGRMGWARSVWVGT